MFLCLARVFRYDHGADGLGEPGAQARAAEAAREAPQVGGSSDELLNKLLSGVSRKWKRKALKYDIRHWMANFSSMVSAEKSSLLFRTFMSYVSDAVYKMLPGEADRVRRHMEKLGMTSETIKQVGRRYWRRRAKYSCPDPETIIRGLVDVFNFFRDMEDPDRPGHRFLVSNAYDIFLKEVKYVQKGLLSDPPGMNMYIRVRECCRTGFIFYRNRRSTCALEGYHLHLRAAQHPCARGSGPQLEMARSLLFDFAWNVKAAVKANIMVDHGHYNIWLVDGLSDVCRGWRGEWHHARPSVLRSHRRTDTTIAPITFRGIPSAALKELKKQGAQAVQLSPLQTAAELRKVLAEPQLVARGDAAGIARTTGVVTSEKRLRQLAAKIKSVAAARALLAAHGVQNLQNRVRNTDGGRAPTADVGAVAATLLEGRACDAAGPLPVDTVRMPLGYAQVQIESPPPLPFADDGDDGGDGGDDDDDGDGDMGAAGEGEEDQVEGSGPAENAKERRKADYMRMQNRGDRPPLTDPKRRRRWDQTATKGLKRKCTQRMADAGDEPSKAKVATEKAKRQSRHAAKRNKDALDAAVAVLAAGMQNIG
jgi:hypothetical protein